MEGEIEADLGPEQGNSQTRENFRSLLITNASENSEIRAETSRVINLETSSQLSRKLEVVKLDHKAHVLERLTRQLRKGYYQLFKVH